MTDPAIRIGVSSCLLGEKVRFDGGHKHDRFVTGQLAAFFELVPVCPEAEVGMGIPRETVRLTGDPEAPRMVGSRSGDDWTGRMNDWSARRVRELGGQDLRGYIFKKDSPSCGAFRVKVHRELGVPPLSGQGLFAAEWTRRNPLVPYEEEGRLNDAVLRDNFIERVFAYDRLKHLFDGRWKRGDAVAFHSREKYLLMAHSPQHYKALGKLVAAISEHTPAAFRDAYMPLFMAGLGTKATPRRHVNALQHVAGHLKQVVGAEVRARLQAVITDYQAGLVPLIVPITLLNHYVELHDVAYVKDQTYLKPHPKELMLRNHV